jgi:hypothetical protein
MRGRSGISKVTKPSLFRDGSVVRVSEYRFLCVTLRAGAEQGAGKAPQSCHRFEEEPSEEQA